MKRKWAIAASLSLAVLVALAILFHGQLNRLRTLATLRRIDNFPLYEMRYYGDYGFGNFLRVGMQALPRLQSYQGETDDEWACTCFVRPPRSHPVHQPSRWLCIGVHGGHIVSRIRERGALLV